MNPKRLLKNLRKDQQEYYIFLAKECFAGFSNAEYNYNIYRYASCYAWLFHTSEFFWKSLTILSGNYFELRHEAFQADMAKISKDLLSDGERVRAYTILSQFPRIKRDLARYGYYEKGWHITASPDTVFNKENTETDLNKVSWLISKLREIHYYQIFEPPIRIGILSGYIQARKEKPCSYYPHSKYRKSIQWMLDLKDVKNDNGSNLFQSSMTSVSDLSAGTFSIVINPFGEAYPELGSAEGVGFRTILSYIQDGGILINSGGQPFVYSWDVNTGNYNMLVNFIPILSYEERNYEEGMPVLSRNESLAIPQEALILKRYFDVETEWDHPEKDIVGPIEAEIEFDKILGTDQPKTSAKVYRPVRQLSDNVRPLVHCPKSLWDGEVYPVAAIKYGRGFLISTGMSLDQEREYKLLLDIVKRLSLVGYQVLATSD
ncbi:MAG TPA: hypothetical protein VE130_14055 [Nitrososphaeraceae archaeon]|jgi:hypothetical protein|nr:hypothetical protein [Nitrososphaeraceae archaeon]